MLRHALVRFAFSLLCVLGLGLTGCVTYIPVDEYNLARAAYESAKEWDAARYAPALWFNAEQTYRTAQKAFRDRRQEEARELFSEARVLCEKAENAARLARYQSGDIIP